jgi:anti-sigma B factor antagonist
MATETVALEGELDFETAFDVEMRLEEAIRTADEVVVDLSRLEFIDSTGIRALLEATRAAEREGTKLRVMPGPPPVQRVFETAGLLDTLPFAA